ncbi:MAG TPA: oleate hydratase [Acetobacteraceae bacterium]
MLRQLRFDRQSDAIMASSACIPTDLPYVNSVWMPRRRSDRPRVVPEGATNFGFLGQLAEIPQDVVLTIEYSARTAREAIHRLFRRGPAAPPVYQGQYDPAALFAAVKTLA